MAASFQALLVRQAFAPLAKARAEHGGLTDRLESTIGDVR